MPSDDLYRTATKDSYGEERIKVNSSLYLNYVNG